MPRKKKYFPSHYDGATVEVSLRIATNRSIEDCKELMEICFIENFGLSRWDETLLVLDVLDVKELPKAEDPVDEFLISLT
jgi:hypothetical protein